MWKMCKILSPLSDFTSVLDFYKRLWVKIDQSCNGEKRSNLTYWCYRLFYVSLHSDRPSDIYIYIFVKFMNSWLLTVAALEICGFTHHLSPMLPLKSGLRVRFIPTSVTQVYPNRSNIWIHDHLHCGTKCIHGQTSCSELFPVWKRPK